MTVDNLGTPRVATDGSGTVQARHDYLPFGEEIGAYGGRASHAQYHADAVRQKYTGLERDSENGLDYAQARYYASTAGRFTSVDPLMASASTTSPQTFNRYTYALNNPYKYVDPSGMEPTSLDESTEAAFGELNHLADWADEVRAAEDEAKRQAQRKQQQQRTIYVFVGVKDRGTPWQPDKDSAKAGYKPTTIPGEDFARVGKNVKVINEGDADYLPQGFTDALQDKNALAVIFLGDTTGTEDSNGVFHSNGLDFGANGALSATSTVGVGAHNVAIFACDSRGIQSMFRFTGNNQSLIGMSSGSDGYSSPGWSSRAAFATANTFEHGGNPDQAVQSANNRFQEFRATAPFGPKNVSMPIRVRNAEPKDVGDRILRRR